MKKILILFLCIFLGSCASVKWTPWVDVQYVFEDGSTLLGTTSVEWYKIPQSKIIDERLFIGVRMWF